MTFYATLGCAISILVSGSLNDQVEMVLRAYQAQADADEIDVEKYLDPDLPAILLHSDSLQAALMNLVKNALESMEPGGQLMVRTYTTRKSVALDLIDTGSGVDDNTVLHMFEPFYSTKEGGSGLGLPTARKIIEAHGGRISVQSEVGPWHQICARIPASQTTRVGRPTENRYSWIACASLTVSIFSSQAAVISICTTQRPSASPVTIQ